MDVKSALIGGLQAEPKYLPVWYRYDTQGSIYNDRCLSDNTYYYFYNSEVEVIGTHVNDIVRLVPEPCILVDMGSGNSEKSRMFIDALLTKQNKLKYMPVDISADFLQETSDACARDYGEKLDVSPIPGDYSVGINKLRDIEGHKLIIWLGGGFQNQSYDVQVERIRSLSETMSKHDMLVIALDVTHPTKADDIKNAYLDPTGVSLPLYMNAIWRLNREYGSDVDTDKFAVEAEFVPEMGNERLSGVRVLARSKCDQTYTINGLGITIHFKAKEALYLHEGENLSCKYTEGQIRTLVMKGRQALETLYVDTQRHAGLCCIRNKVPS